MVLWALTLVLGVSDGRCGDAARWEAAGLQAPCVLVGTPAERLAAAQNAWGLTAAQAQCALDAASFKWPPYAARKLMTEPERVRLEDDSQEGWRRCVRQWPAEPMLWRAAVLSWNYHTPFGALLELLPPAAPDGGRVLADALLDLDSAPDAELAAWLLRAEPGRLVSLLRDPRVDHDARFELAMGFLERRTPTDAEWAALAMPLVTAPLRRDAWLSAAEQWLRLPEALRAQLGASLAQAPLRDQKSDLRARLVLGLLALGRPDEARRVKLEPRADDDAETGLVVEAIDWALTGQRERSPWDAAIAARDLGSLGWEAWEALMPYLRPHEAMFASTFATRVEREREARRTSASGVVALLRRGAERSRDKLVALAPRPARDPGVPPGLPEVTPSPFVERVTPWEGAAPRPAARDRVRGGFRPVRVEAVGKRLVALALSQRLDPVGEVTHGGYWLLLSGDGGATWESLYLALGHYRPFLALERSTVPLLGDDDVVRVAVRDAPLDERSITFPPLEVEAPTRRELVVLEAPLAALRKDSDGDGLTDLVEARLLLDPTRADTDGDGVRDGDDPTPRLDDRLPPTLLAEVYNAFFDDFLGGRPQPAALVVAPGKRGLKAARGQARAAQLDDVRFISGVAAELAGLRPLTRFINLDAAELAVAKARFGEFYPMHLEVVLNGADHAYLTWGERWRGGAVRLDRDARGKLVVTRIRSWVT